MALMIKYFQGELDGKHISHFTSQLDYSIDSLEERVEKLHEILNTQTLEDGTKVEDEFFVQYFDTKKHQYFNVHPTTTDPTSCDDYVCRQLEYMANYLLHSKENLQYNDECEYPIETENSKYKKEKQNNSLEGTQEQNSDKLEHDLQKEKVKQYDTQTKNKIEERDMEEISQIKLLQEDILLLRNRILKDDERRTLIEEGTIKDNTEEEPLMSIREKIKIRKLMKELRQLQLDIKRIVRRPIKFKNIIGGKPKYTLFDNTGYYNKQGEYVLLSENKLEFSNPSHIYELIKLYSGLKEMCFDDLNSDLRYILWELEDLIDSTPLQPHERDILIWKIDGLSEKAMLKILKEKHNKKFTRQRLSELFTLKIPQMIVDTYLEKKIDWHYIFKLRGKYKRCTKCGEIKLATTRYFSPKKKGLYGLQSICRKCR